MKFYLFLAALLVKLSLVFGNIELPTPFDGSTNWIGPFEVTKVEKFNPIHMQLSFVDPKSKEKFVLGYSDGFLQRFSLGDKVSFVISRELMLSDNPEYGAAFWNHTTGQHVYSFKVLSLIKN